MSERVAITCPECGRGLRVRVRDLGRKGHCRHCGRLFRAQVPDLAELLKRQSAAVPEARWEQERGALIAEYERRMNDQDARFEAERRAWDRQCDEHARLAAEWESLAHEVAEVQSRLIDDREALAREVNQLRDRVAALEAELAAARGSRNVEGPQQSDRT